MAHFWFDLVLPEPWSDGFARDIGSGDPAYTQRAARAEDAFLVDRV
jgi:hypothetical protein